jgi:hypothetical protein
LQRRDQIAVLSIEWADAAEMLIMFRDFEEPLAGNIPAAEDIFQKWDDFVGGFRTAERDD